MGSCFKVRVFPSVLRRTSSHMTSRCPQVDLIQSVDKLHAHTAAIAPENKGNKVCLDRTQLPYAKKFVSHGHNKIHV